MSGKAWIGIDPGQSGGLSLVSASFVEARPMPVHDKEDVKKWGSPIDWMEVFLVLRNWFQPGTIAIVEQSQAFRGQGVSSTFKYGASYGGILAVLQAVEIPYRLVRPHIWTKTMFGEPYTERDKTDDTVKKRKAFSIAYCNTRWPSMTLLKNSRCRTPSDGLADALCLAAYGEMLESKSR